jgi:porin
MVFDPRNAQDPDVVEHPFEDATSVALSMTVPTKIAGLRGYYGLRGVVSNNEGLNLANIPGLFLPSTSQADLTKKGYWYVNGSVQQFLYEDPNHPGAGWGFFAYASIADGNPNPIKWTAYFGLAGNNPYRHMDRWGVAYFKYGISKDLLNGLSTLGIQRQDEQGVEAFYNIGVTPWLQLTADIQWIDPFQSDRNNAIVTTLRLRTLF